jgi:hypothetical protein
MSGPELSGDALDSFPELLPGLPDQLLWTDETDIDGLSLPAHADSALPADSAAFARVIDAQYGGELGPDATDEEPGTTIDRALSPDGIPPGEDDGDDGAEDAVDANGCQDDVGGGGGGTADDGQSGRLSSAVASVAAVSGVSPATPASGGGRRRPRKEASPAHVPATPHPALEDVRAAARDGSLDDDEYLLERSVREAELSKQRLREELKREQREAEAAAAAEGRPLTSAQKERGRSRRESAVTRRRAEVYLRELEGIVRQVPALQRELLEALGGGDAVEGSPGGSSASGVADRIERLGLTGERGGEGEKGGTGEGDGESAPQGLGASLLSSIFGLGGR